MCARNKKQVCPCLNLCTPPTCSCVFVCVVLSTHTHTHTLTKRPLLATALRTLVRVRHRDFKSCGVRIPHQATRHRQAGSLKQGHREHQVPFGNALEPKTTETTPTEEKNGRTCETGQRSASACSDSCLGLLWSWPSCTKGWSCGMETATPRSPPPHRPTTTPTPHTPTPTPPTHTHTHTHPSPARLRPLASQHRPLTSQMIHAP